MHAKDDSLVPQVASLTSAQRPDVVPPLPAALQLQFEVVANLYQHEDLLNWGKVKTALLVNGGLIALIQLPHAAKLPPYLLGICGAMVSALYLVSIVNGQAFRRLRRATLDRLETEITRYGGIENLISAHNDISPHCSTQAAMILFMVSIIVAWVSFAWLSLL